MLRCHDVVSGSRGANFTPVKMAFYRNTTLRGVGLANGRSQCKHARLNFERRGALVVEAMRRGRRLNPNIRKTRTTPINEEINAYEVRLLDERKEMLGVCPLSEALLRAQDLKVDVVMVNDKTDPPLCRLIEYSKFKYEQEKAASATRRKQRAARVETKELKMRPNTDVHDYQVRLRKATSEISKGNHIKLIIQFRGREIQFKDQGRDLCRRFREDVGEAAMIEKQIRMEGRAMTMVLAPAKSTDVKPPKAVNQNTAAKSKPAPPPPQAQTQAPSPPPQPQAPVAAQPTVPPTVPPQQAQAPIAARPTVPQPAPPPRQPQAPVAAPPTVPPPAAAAPSVAPGPQRPMRPTPAPSRAPNS